METIAVSVVFTLLVCRYSAIQVRRRNLVWLSYLTFVVLFLSGCTVGPVQLVGEIANIVAGIVPLIAASVMAVEPQDAAAIAAAVNLVVGGINAIKNLVQDYQKSPNASKLSEIQAAMTDVQANLKEIELAGQIKDPATQAKVAAIVQSAVLSLAAVESSLTATAGATNANPGA